MLALFSFRGRADRREFWLCGVTPLAGLICLALLASPLISQTDGPLDNTASLVSATLVLLVVLLTLAVGARRLHDRGKSALWLVPYLYAPAFLTHMPETAIDEPAVIAAGMIAVLLLIWGFIDLGFLQGTPGPNRFGPATWQESGRSLSRQAGR